MAKNIHGFNCDWGDCSVAAVAHVRFGFGESGNVSRGNLHRDLCEHHIGEIESRFSNAVRNNLGECPDGCKEVLNVP